MTPTLSYTTHPLNQATTLHHIGIDRFKTARLSLTFLQPANERTSPLLTLLFGVMRRGSEGYPRLCDFNRRLDELYGTTLTIRNHLHGDCHVLSFTAEVPEDRFLPPEHRHLELVAGVLELLAELVLHPLTENHRLRESAVAAERQSLCDSLRSATNDPRTYAADHFRRAMCPDEPYGLSIGGDVDTVEAATSEAVTAAWRDLLSQCCCRVYYVGRTPAPAIVRAWDKSFGDWQPVSRPLTRSVAHRPPATLRRIEETLPVAQGKLCLGWSLGENRDTIRDPDTMAALYVCNELLGVMQNSRLFRRVREELGLCYYCESALDMTKGILWVSCGIQNQHREEAETAILTQMESLMDGHVTQAEVDMAILSLLNSYRQVVDSQSALEAFYFRAEMDHDPTAIGEQMAAIRRVTPAAVTAVAARFRLDTVYFLRGTAPGTTQEVDDE